MTHNFKENAERMKDEVEYKLAEMHEYMQAEVDRLRTNEAKLDEIIIGQRDIIVKYKALLASKERVAA